MVPLHNCTEIENLYNCTKIENLHNYTEVEGNWLRVVARTIASTTRDIIIVVIIINCKTCTYYLRNYPATSATYRVQVVCT